MTNFDSESTACSLEVLFDADFADETAPQSRRPRGRTHTRWTRTSERCGELEVRWTASHLYYHQGHFGRARLSRRVAVRIESDTLVPRRTRRGFRMLARLEPHERRSVEVMITPTIDEPLQYPVQRSRDARIPKARTLFE